MFDIEIVRQSAKDTVSVKTESPTLEVCFIPINQLFLGQRFLNVKSFLSVLGNSVSLAFCLTGSNWSNDKEHAGRKMTVCLFAVALGFNVTEDKEKNDVVLSVVDEFLESLFPEAEGDFTDIISVTNTAKPQQHVFF